MKKKIYNELQKNIYIFAIPNAFFSIVSWSFQKNWNLIVWLSSFFIYDIFFSIFYYSLFLILRMIFVMFTFILTLLLFSFFRKIFVLLATIFSNFFFFQKDFDTFHMPLCSRKAFLCFFDNIQLASLYIEKKMFYQFLYML